MLETLLTLSCYLQVRRGGGGGQEVLKVKQNISIANERLTVFFSRCTPSLRHGVRGDNPKPYQEIQLA